MALKNKEFNQLKHLGEVRIQCLSAICPQIFFCLTMLTKPTFKNAVLTTTAIQKEVQLPSLIYIHNSTCKHSPVWMPH